MKKILVSLFTLCLSYFAMAQAPSMICYQGVASNASGAELVSTDISVRASIVKGTPLSTPIYTETHEVKTDQFGLFTLDLGSKAMAGTGFAYVNWNKGPYFLKIEMAVPKGAAYKDLGTTQLLSVPYALHSGSADTSLVAKTALTALTALTAVNDKDTDPMNELQGLQFDKATGKLKLVPASPTTTNEVVVSDGDADPKNELQTLKFDDKTGVMSLYDAQGMKNSEVGTRNGVFTQPGASAAFPQGIVGTYRFVKSSETYTVPVGKTFYVTANGNANVTSSLPMDVELGTSGKLKVTSYGHCQVFPGGTKITNSTFTGFEIEANSKIEAVIIDLKSAYYISPNKVLFIKSGLGPSNNTLDVDGELTSFYAPYSGSQCVTIPGGSNGLTIKNPIGFVTVLTGYLLDMP